jgi:hypothetical protein
VSNSDVWCQKQIELTRQYVAREIDNDTYGSGFMAAQNAAAREGEIPDEATYALLDDLLYAVANNSGPPYDSWPDQLDDEQLRETQARHLADWDDGTYAETWWDR